MIDTHVHFWDRRLLRYPWMDDVPTLPMTHGPEDLLELPNSDGFIAVEAGAREDDAYQEALWAIGLRAPGCLGLVAYAPLGVAKGRERLEELTEVVGIVGVRSNFARDTADEESWRYLARNTLALADTKLAVDVNTGWDDFTSVETFARHATGTSVVVNHLGKPKPERRPSPEKFEAWQVVVRGLARIPNIVVKLSGLTSPAHSPVPLEHWSPYVGFAFEMFGPDRCMIGSDAPIATVSRPEWFDLVKSWIKPSDREWTAITSETPRRVYQIGRKA